MRFFTVTPTALADSRASHLPPGRPKTREDGEPQIFVASIVAARVC
jgi:hypothetical protein